MGEEYGETNPFQYFISHGDPQLVDAVCKGRREEFAAFGWGGALPDPQAVSTFESSKLDRSKLGHPQHAGMAALYRDLIALRKRFELRGSGFEGDGGESAAACRDDVINLERPAADGRRLVAFFNCSDREHEVTLPDGSWELVLSTDDAKYAGRVAAAVQAAARGAATRSAGGSRVSGEEWKETSLEPRTSNLQPWTAVVFATESNQ
jgi:maltooligosyltrehalose trehalohydrolase